MASSTSWELFPMKSFVVAKKRINGEERKSGPNETLSTKLNSKNRDERPTSG